MPIAHIPHIENVFNMPNRYFRRFSPQPGVSVNGIFLIIVYFIRGKASEDNAFCRINNSEVFETIFDFRFETQLEFRA